VCSLCLAIYLMSLSAVWDSDYPNYLDLDQVSVLGNWPVDRIDVDVADPTAFPQLDRVISAFQSSSAPSSARGSFDLGTLSSSDDSSSMSEYAPTQSEDCFLRPDFALQHSLYVSVQPTPSYSYGPIMSTKASQMNWAEIAPRDLDLHYTCPIAHCLTTYKKRARLTAHLREEHGEEGENLARAMTIRFRRTDGPKNFACPEPGCSLMYVRKKDMYRHFRLKHKNSDPSLLKACQKQRKAKNNNRNNDGFSFDDMDSDTES